VALADQALASKTVAGVEETRARILAATRKLYATKGSRGTTTREVADRAGVNEATLFRHFGTKLQLISEMLDHYSGATNFAEIVERARSLPTVEERLQALALAAVDALRRKEDLIKISMAEQLTNPEGHLCAWRAPTAARQKLTQFFAESVQRGELRGEPGWLARVFMSLFFSLVIARGIWEEESQAPASAVATMVDIFLNGARAR
jgi:AcrR family transcriptional regulator